MRSYLDCIPCFFRQALEGARLAGVSERGQKRIIDGLARVLPGISLGASPPEIAALVYGLLRPAHANGDPYLRIKRKSNAYALRLLPELRDKVRRSSDRLLTAVELAIAGNIIDFGVKNNLDLKKELAAIMAQERRSVSRRSIFHYAVFKRFLRRAGDILYLADNAGETVFDRILIEEINRLYPDKSVSYAVKEKPVINDALAGDARACGIGKSALVVSNGSAAPGTVLSLCSKEFRRKFSKADMVISKGQGNFESLSGCRRRVFFLFMVKCPVVARASGCAMGDTVLLDNFS